MPTNLPKVPVLCIAQDQAGAPLAGGKFEARLDRLETYNGFVVPEVTTGIADADGACVLSLWPNSLGTAGSTYRVRAWSAAGKRYLDGYAVVPNASCELQDILIATSPPDLDMAVTAAAQAAASAAAAAQSAADAAASAGGGVSPGGASYTHAQAAPSAVWTVPHNLGRYPSITVTDHLGNVVVPDVQYVSASIVQVTHGSAIAGFAYCN